MANAEVHKFKTSEVCDAGFPNQQHRSRPVEARQLDGSCPWNNVRRCAASPTQNRFLPCLDATTHSPIKRQLASFIIFENGAKSSASGRIAEEQGRNRSSSNWWPGKTYCLSWPISTARTMIPSVIVESKSKNTPRFVHRGAAPSIVGQAPPPWHGFAISFAL